MIIFSGMAIALHLRHHAGPGRLPSQPAAPRSGHAGAQLQHGGRPSSPTPTGRTTAARPPCRTSPRSARSPCSSSSAPAVGIAVAIALVRGFSRRNSPTIGNFWVDMTRCMLLHPPPDRVRRRHHLRGPGRGADPGRAGHCPRLPQRRHPDHRPGPGRLHGAHQAARYQRRRLLQRQRRPSLREPDWPDEFPVLRAACSASRSPSRTPSGRWWAASATGAALLAAMADHLRRLGGLHSLRRAPAQPGRRQPPTWLTPHGQHGGQGGPLRAMPTTLFNVPPPRPRPGVSSGANDSFTPWAGSACSRA